MQVHFVIHESFEAPGAYLAWAALRGHEVAITKVYQFEPLPETADDFDLLIVMGGPQSPTSTQEEFPHYNAQAEIDLIQKAIKADKYIIGVCLGAQLLGQAYGGTCLASPEREIGNFPIELTQAGRSDSRLSHIPQGLVVGHWHGDMPGLSEGAQILATSQGCPRQIVAYSHKHFGFQAHLELTKDLVKQLLAQEKDIEGGSQKYTYVQGAKDILAYDYDQMNQALYQFLDKLTQS
ncbi:glutamine amidotransferase-related protein [Streptococcus downei]|uniref:Glutamine amidotransferase n=1 Tax=Streptococcus downei MFe28 TaxID=764290 RepID=A0A380JH72_STRDO|nr:gamma-glutamyl-gamma-aminobutyrate hydrolase family protein [Streptococcus downei]EFQ57986.1 class I glutamine amidotransferase [Streptococcus downei F0415]SUN36790.1 glutamine amidotransferase [Streptococcus downei MFe28]